MLNLNSNKLLEKFFVQVPNAIVDLTSGSVGFISNNGDIITLKNGVITASSLIDLTLAIPAFATRTNLNDLNTGDIIRLNDIEYAFFRELIPAREGVPASIKVTLGTGEIREVAAVNDILLGTGGVLAVRNIFGGLATNGGDIMSNPMLLMALGNGGGLTDNDAFKNLFLMQALAGGQSGGLGNLSANPLLMMSLLGGKSGNGGIDLTTLMLMGGLGGNGGNPLAGLFGGVSQQAAPAAAPVEAA